MNPRFFSPLFPEMFPNAAQPYDYLYTDINEAIELLTNVPMSALVRQLELVCEREPQTFQKIAQWLREAEHRTPERGYEVEYDRE